MKIKILFVLLLYLLTTFSVSAINETQKISLEQAIENALSNNPQLKISELDIENSKNNIEVALRFQNPSLYTSQNMGDAAKGNSQLIGADYTIELLKRGKRKDIAKSKAIEVAENKKFQEYSLIYEVKKTYLDLLVKKTNLKLIDEQKKLSKEVLDSIIKTKNSKKYNKTDIIEAKILYNRAVIYHNIAKSEVISAQNRFNAIMNTSTIDYDTLEDSLTNDYSKFLTINPANNKLKFDKIKDYTLSHRFDLLAMQQEVETAKKELKLVKAKLIPDLTIVGAWAYKTKGISEDDAFHSGAYAEAIVKDVPLLYRYKPEIKIAENNIKKAQLKYEDMVIDITRNITDAWEKYSIARENLLYYNKELLVNSKELLDVSVQSFKNKEIDLTSYTVSKKMYLELMLGYVSSLEEYYISYAELLKEMNIGSIEDI